MYGKAVGHVDRLPNNDLSQETCQMTDPATTDLSEVSEAIAETVALQNAGLELLRAEMKALAAVIQAAIPHRAPSEEETDAGFDNVPL
jgi:hypothetical protein